MCQRVIGKRDKILKGWWICFAFLVSIVLVFPSYGVASKGGGTQQAPLWAWVNVRETHVRQQPTVKSPSLGILRKGQVVRTLKSVKEWTKVEYELGKTGWIFSKNISPGLPATLPEADRILYLKEVKTGNRGVVEVFFNGAIGNKVKMFSMKSPVRLIMDLPGMKSSRNRTFSLTKASFVSKVKIGVHPDKSRVVLYLNNKIRKFSHKISLEKNSLSLAFLLGGQAVATNAATKNVQKTAKIHHQKKKKEAIKATHHIKRLAEVIRTGFRDETTRSMVVLKLTEKPAYYYIRFKNGKVGLILDDAFISKRYMRFMDTSAFPTPVKKIEFKNVTGTKEGRKAEVWVTVKGMIKNDVAIDGTTLKWIFQKPEEYIAKAQKTQKVQKFPVKKSLVKTSATVVQKPKMKTASKVAKPVASTNESKRVLQASAPSHPLFIKKKYTGTKMSFDFQQADIHNVLRLIAEVSNLNIVAGDDVRGKITLRLKNVPWDQALDIILESQGLGKQRIGNVLRIAPISKLKKEMQEKISAKKTVEKLEPLVTSYIPINYTTAKNLSIKVKPMLSSRGTVMVDDRTNTLIIKDIAKKVKDVKALVKKLDTPTPEVLIESRIVEATKDFTREIGIKWGANYNAGPQYGNAPSSNFPNAMNVRGGATGQAGGGTTTGTGTTGGTGSMPSGILPNVNLPAAASYGALGVTLEQVANIFTLDAELTAMEDNGKGRIISSPRIATLDNKTAKIEQGLRIPYLKITEEGTVTTEFIEANLNMEVTPHVSNDKMINMQVQVSKDTPDWSHLVQGVPSIDKKEATTNVMVRDGGVTAIGGIFTIERTNSIHKVPFFGDIPILGWAFKNKRTVKNRKELLIFISPKLIPLKESRKK